MLFPSQVISASRRTDLAGCFPGSLAEWIHQGFVTVRNPFNQKERRVSLDPAVVHTLVLWSKNYQPLLANAGGLRDSLQAFEQVFFHFTITGLGGSPWELGVPHFSEAVRQLKPLAALAGDPRRIQWRFDPVVFWQEGRTVRGNLKWFSEIAAFVRDAGLQWVLVSFCQGYQKSERRIGKTGIRRLEPRHSRLRILGAWLAAAADRAGLAINSCCSPDLIQAGLPAAACIDGPLLVELHPRHLPLDMKKDPGQRPQCRCAVSSDIGSYDQPCPHGCLYCYANPDIRSMMK
jgi:hypothetical protein